VHWLRHAELAIETLPNVCAIVPSSAQSDSQDDLLPNIQPLHAFFLKVLLPSTAPTLPKPGRPIRHLVARCLVKLHKKVESRSLFDFVQAVVKAVSDGGNKNMNAAENVSRV